MSAQKKLITRIKQDYPLPLPGVRGLITDGGGHHLPWDEFKKGVGVLVPPQPVGVKGDIIRAHFGGYYSEAELEDPTKEQLIIVGDTFPPGLDPDGGSVFYINLASGQFSKPLDIYVENYAPRLGFVGFYGGASIPVDVLDRGLTIRVDNYYQMQAGDVVRVIIDEVPISRGFSAQKTLTQADVDHGITIECPKEYTQSLEGKFLKMLAIVQHGSDIRHSPDTLVIVQQSTAQVTVALPSWINLEEFYQYDPDADGIYILYPITEDIGGIKACEFFSRLDAIAGKGDKVTFYLFELGQGNGSFSQTLDLEEDGGGIVSFVVPERYLHFSGIKRSVVIVEKMDGNIISSGVMFWASPDFSESQTTNGRQRRVRNKN